MNDQLVKMYRRNLNEIMFNRSWKTFKKVQEQAKMEENLMRKSKSAMQYNVKFGFGTSYNKRVVKKSVS
jgi:hypothetical protein